MKGYELGGWRLSLDRASLLRHPQPHTPCHTRDNTAVRVALIHFLPGVRHFKDHEGTSYTNTSKTLGIGVCLFVRIREIV